MATVRHAFDSAKDDPVDSTVVGASKWDADHELEDVASQTDLDALADVVTTGGASAHIADAEDAHNASAITVSQVVIDTDVETFILALKSSIALAYTAFDVIGAAAAAQLTAEAYADAQDAAYQNLLGRGTPLGYASLDSDGQVPGNQLSEVSVDGGVVGFYGVVPVARTVMATGTGKTVDNIITALQSLGLFIQTSGAGGSGSLFDTGVFDTATFGAS